MIPTGQEEEGEDQGIIQTSQLTTDSSRRITLMILQTRGETRSSQELRRSVAHSGDGSSNEGQCCTMDCEARGGLVGLLWQPNGHLEVRQRATHSRSRTGDSKAEERR